MMTSVIFKPLTVGKWAKEGGGFSYSLSAQAEDALQRELSNIMALGREVVDVKTNHFTVMRHNNGGCDEVWVQFTILYT